MHRSPPRAARVLPAIVLPLLAFIAVVPLLAHGVSCGHDFEFHLESWLDAAAQMRHGTLDPGWTFSAAWNAGEPRFIFYPPISWMLGALLALIMPFRQTPIVFTGVALLGAAISMYSLARDYTSRGVAILASAFYIASPYMLFTGFERTAYGELLAAAWFPLLFRAALRRVPSITGMACAIALLWLTNAPAAVMGMYTLLLIALARIAQTFIAEREQAKKTITSLTVRFGAGGALGLATAAFYLLPAAYERRYVQVAMAIIPNMRVEDNFLFGHTGDAPHDAVLHTASLIAAGMLTALLVALIAAFASERRALPENRKPAAAPLAVFVSLAICIGFLLTPVSIALWHHLPELAFLQFPWRLLSVLGVALALTIAVALRFISESRTSLALTSTAAFVFLGAMTAWQIHAFRQPCEVLDRPSARAHLFTTHHGVEPTDEYTPTDADNDVLRSDDPGYWLASNPSAFAPATVPNPAATFLNYDSPPPTDQTISGIAPHHLQLNLSAPATLVLNLRDYPSWRVFRNGSLDREHLQRDDGLLAIALPAGPSTIDVRWHRTPDQFVGDTISILALILLVVLLLRSRTINRDA